MKAEKHLNLSVEFTNFHLCLYFQKILSSFQTEMLEKFGYGHVKYSIKVVLKRSSRQANGETCYIPFTGVLKPSWKPNYEYVLAFTVKTIVDLNTIPKAAVKLFLHDKLTYCHTSCIGTRTNKYNK
ncbi:hypothetical protein OUZ56_024545 [Daphnia magna]|uniref:Arrestin-like N-terminal domain-containing protein n=1 Tax=Daphnia magna TaxID=35525 RepID=A0ABR0B178_9CRUS|nr:hypothetical protein OUZ56_024545 [Daphnia magna]